MPDVSEIYRQFMKDSYKAIQDAHKEGIELGKRMENKKFIKLLEKLENSGLGQKWHGTKHEGEWKDIPLKDVIKLIKEKAND
jgi:hypothetical protein